MTFVAPREILGEGSSPGSRRSLLGGHSCASCRIHPHTFPVGKKRRRPVWWWPPLTPKKAGFALSLIIHSSFLGIRYIVKPLSPRAPSKIRYFGPYPHAAFEDEKTQGRGFITTFCSVRFLHLPPPPRSSLLCSQTAMTVVIMLRQDYSSRHITPKYIYFTRYHRVRHLVCVCVVWWYSCVSARSVEIPSQLSWEYTIVTPAVMHATIRLPRGG